MPPAWVHLNAWSLPGASVASPTTTEPSAETPKAADDNPPQVPRSTIPPA